MHRWSVKVFSTALWFEMKPKITTRLITVAKAAKKPTKTTITTTTKLKEKTQTITITSTIITTTPPPPKAATATLTSRLGDTDIFRLI